MIQTHKWFHQISPCRSNFIPVSRASLRFEIVGPESVLMEFSIYPIFSLKTVGALANEATEFYHAIWIWISPWKSNFNSSCEVWDWSKNNNKVILKDLAVKKLTRLRRQGSHRSLKNEIGKSNWVSREK